MQLTAHDLQTFEAYKKASRTAASQIRDNTPFCIFSDNSESFSSTVGDLGVFVTKAAWLTGHPKREENKKATDRMLTAMNFHRQDGVGFQKQAAVVIGKWQNVEEDIKKALQ